MTLYVAIGLIVFVIILMFLLLAYIGSFYRKVGPNQALIVYGSGGTKILQGGGRIVWPVIERATEFSLELMSFDVAPQQDLYTTQGVAVNVEAVAQIKVKSDPESIRTAAEQFLSKDQSDREGLIRLVMEGHLRGIVGQLTVENLVKDPESVAEKMRTTCALDLDKMGLEVVSFTIKEVRDKNEYIANMGKPEIARVKKEADIAAAIAERDTATLRSQTMREAAVARAEADQARVIAETASAGRQAQAQRELNVQQADAKRQVELKQAEAKRDVEIKQAEYDTQVKTTQAQRDKAYDIQANTLEQQVITEKVKILEAEKTAQVRVQQTEIQRRDLELQATVLKAADAESKRVQTVAEAERRRLTLEAEGRGAATKAAGQAEAEAAKARGMSEAEVILAKGRAEAEVILAKGRAEAEAMKMKAAAFQEYNQAAVLDKLLTGLPEMVRAVAEPLTKVDKVTIVSTGGNGSGLGASRLTDDVMKMVAQVPVLFETISGQKISDLFARVPNLTETKNGTGNGASNEPEASLNKLQAIPLATGEDDNVSVVCPTCNTVNPTTASSCSKCGTPLFPTPAAPAKGIAIPEA